MKRRSAGIGLALLLALALLPSLKASEWTLVLTPVRYSVLQVCFDITLKRPVVLVSYQSALKGEDIRLHVWNGVEWLPISRRDLAEVRFLEVVPGRVVAIGDVNTLPADLLQTVAWCPQIIAIEKMDRASLVEALGKVFRFSAEEWAWFAARYRLSVEDLSRARPDWFAQPSAQYAPRRLPLFKRHRPSYRAQPLPIRESAIVPGVRMDEGTLGERKSVPPPPKDARDGTVPPPAPTDGQTLEAEKPSESPSDMSSEAVKAMGNGGNNVSEAEVVPSGIK